MNRRRHSSSARAVLGAMSWRLPEDDWESPWSFESEWIAPTPEDLVRKEAVKTEDTGEEAKRMRPQAGMPAAVTSVAEVTEKGHLFARPVLQFEEVEDEPEPPLPARLPPVQTSPSPLAASPPAPANDRFRPPEERELKKEPTSKEVKSQGLPVAVSSAAAAKVAPTQTTVPASKPPPEPSSPAGSSRKPLPRHSSRSSWGTLISLSLGTLGFTLLAWIYLHDTPRESDEDLRPQVAVDQSPVTQAPLKLQAFVDSILPPGDPGLRSQPVWLWDGPSLAAYIRVNAPALDNLRDLLEDNDWHPYHSQWHRADYSDRPGWASVASLLQAQAFYLARQGNEEPAFSAAMDLARLSRHLQEVWAWPGYMQRSLELHTAAMQTLSVLLKTTRLDSATLGRFQVELSLCRLEESLMRQACGAYYVHEKKILLGPGSGELLDTMPEGRQHQRPARLFFKVNETLSLFASAFRELRDEMSRPPYTRLSVASSPVSRIRLTSPRFYHPNSGGETYFGDRIEPLLQLPQDYNLTQARQGLVECLFAMRRHLADRHKLPLTSQELVPGYLQEVPKDPFSGEPVHYNPSRGLLYSVGINLISEGGRPVLVPMADDREPTLELGVAVAVPVKGK